MFFKGLRACFLFFERTIEVLICTNPQQDFFLLDPNLSSFQYLAFLVPGTSNLVSYKDNLIFLIFLTSFILSWAS